jgi:hypothetical protein
MSVSIIQKADLSTTSFSNNNSNAAGGISVRVNAGSDVGNAISTALSPTTIATSIAGSTAAQATLAAAIADDLGATAAETIAGTEAVKFVSPDDLKAWYNVYKPGVFYAVKTATNTTLTANASQAMVYDQVEQNSQTCGTFNPVTGVYTASRPCLVDASANAHVVFTSATGGSGETSRNVICTLIKNGSQLAVQLNSVVYDGSGQIGLTATVSTHVALEAGDTLQANVSAGTAGGLTGITLLNFGSRFSSFSMTVHAL